MLTAGLVILCLKVAVAAVTVLLLASLTALYFGNYRLHGRLNIAFFALTVAALLVFEVVLRYVKKDLFDQLWGDPEMARMLTIHLCFSVPAALLMPFMLFTGLSRRSSAHLLMSWVFGVLWAGTFVTGVFFLPHR